MRLHHLSITAFGPFAGTTEIDFDDLSDAGLFLLTGPTGAGKSSVLDAVCFGLYGEVPGERHTAKHLRSDHAVGLIVPRVILTLSVAGRTLRFTRTPPWDRPKKRSPQSFTRQHASVVVEERLGHDWVGLTTRMDDAGLLVTDLLGMDLTQFTQVAMLPQGKFQTFLQASSSERHGVLQKLFRTDRFEQVERWLTEHRISLRRRSEQHEQAVSSLLSRVEEVSGANREEDPAVWIEQVLARAEADRIRAAAALTDSARLADSSQRALDRARITDAARRRGMAARAVAARLDATVETRASHAERLAHHSRAQATATLHQHAERAGERRARLASSLSAALTTAGLPTDTTPGDLDAALIETRQRVRDLAAFDAREQHLQEVRQSLALMAEERLTLRGKRAPLLEAQRSLPLRLEQMRLDVESALAASASLAGLDSAHRQLARSAEAAARLVERRAALVAGQQLLHAAIDEQQTLREHWLAVRELRLSSMAGELALQLASGCSCPVCGSASHPAPAAAAAGAGREEEDAARRAAESGTHEVDVRRESLAPLESEVAMLSALAGDTSAEDWRLQVTDSLEALTATRAIAQGLDGLRRELLALESESARLDSERTTLDAALADLDQRVAVLKHTRDDVVVARRALLADDEDLQATLSEARLRLGHLEEASSALQAREGLESEWANANEAADAAAAQAGFTSRAECLAHVLAAASVSDLERELTAAERDEIASTQTLADPDVIAALAGGEHPLSALEEASRQATTAHLEATGVHDRAVRASTRLAGLRDSLEVALAEWAPVTEQLAVVTHLAAFVEGKSADNAWKMRLSAYVLSERLRQVVASANERLGDMSEARYTLIHSDARGAGELRGGLSLLVRDEWTGAERDPATLSGGETFIVSLALALGLADTVSREAGGTDIDTLFIDEGFGSLDSDTLEGVLDTLDGLREGGRVIGVVSHVLEMRSRITTQVEVIRGRAGSSLQVVLAAE